MDSNSTSDGLLRDSDNGFHLHDDFDSTRRVGGEESGDGHNSSPQSNELQEPGNDRRTSSDESKSRFELFPTTDNLGAKETNAIGYDTVRGSDSITDTADSERNLFGSDTESSTETSGTRTKGTSGLYGGDSDDSSGGGRSDNEDGGELSKDEQTPQKYGEIDLPELPRGVTEKVIERIVSSAWLSHMLEGSIQIDFVKKNLPQGMYVPKGWTVAKLLLLPHVAVRLEARGVPKPSEVNLLTPEQVQALMIITNNRGARWNYRLKQAGITVAKWDSWMKQPTFRQAFDNFAEGRLKDAVSEGITALSDNAADGDINAIKLVLEMTGRHNPNGDKQVDVQGILLGIVEILQQEVTDVEVLMRIVNRIKGLQTGIGLGQGQVRGEIVQ